MRRAAPFLAAAALAAATPHAAAAASDGEGWRDAGIINFFVPPYTDEMLRAGLDSDHVVGIERYIEWAFLEPAEGDFQWHLLDDVIELWSSRGKFVDFRITTANNMPDDSPSWLFDEYNVRRIVEYSWCSFEDGATDDYEVVDGEVVSEGAPYGDRALRGRGAAGTETVLLRTAVPGGLLKPSLRYSIQFDYRVEEGGDFFVRASSASGGADAERVARWSASAGDEGLRTLSVELGGHDDYILEWGIDGAGALLIDNVNFVSPDDTYLMWRGNIAGFPNYFDPVFQEKWVDLLRAVGERYDGDPRVRTISVGGMGRWEEVMLDNNVMGSLDEQWFTYGYTDESYVDHLRWAIAETKEHFPNKKWRIQLAFGLNNHTPKELMYRGMAAYAESQGIELKQNGIGDHYGTFGEDTHATYTFNRMRHRDGAVLIYETGGQMYNNNFWLFEGLSGHPVSCLNRILIDGADFMYLYAPDIRTEGVNRYFHAVMEQLGRPVLTTYYNWLGDWSMEHETWDFGPVEYEHQWLGIRLHRSTNFGLPALDTLHGERIARTRHSHSQIQFDVDDRQMHQGLYGATLHIDHFDTGRGPIGISGHDGRRGAWRAALGSIPRTNSGQWELDSLHVAPTLFSERGSGADIQSDIVLRDNRAGFISARLVELTAVPAMPWRREAVAESPATSQRRILAEDEEIEFAIPRPEGRPAAFIELKLAAGSVIEGAGRIFAEVEGPGGEWGTRKEYFYPADGDDFLLPIANAPQFGEYRVRLYDAENGVGVYLGADGAPAWKLHAYDPRPMAAQPFDAAGTELEFPAPAFALRLPAGAGAGLQARLVKILPSTRDTAPEAVVAEGAFEPADGFLEFAFEPQTAGRYRLEVHGGADAAEIVPVGFHHLVPPRAARPNRPGRVVAEVDLASAERRNLEPHGDALRIAGLRPAIEAEVDGAPAAAADHWVEFTLRNESGSGMARVWWAAPGEEFHASRSILIPVVSNDTEAREYAFPLGREEGWGGAVGRLRLEPATGATNAGIVAVERLALTSVR